MTPLLATIVFCVFILPINERVAFTQPADNKQVVIGYLLKLLFAIFFFFLTYFVINFVQRIRAKDSDYINWLKYSSIYFAIMLLVFVLIYPGHWVWDEFNILHSVKHYFVDAWQHYFTNIFYTFSLYLIPTGVSIVLFQITFASLVVGYVVNRAQKLFKNKRLAYWLLAVFLLPPIVLNNFYPLRLTMYSYLELLLIAKLLFLYFDKLKTANKYTELLIFSFLIMMVSFWRTEGIYYLALLPVIFVALNIFAKKDRRTLQPYIFTAVSLAIVLFGFAVTRLTHNDRYDVTSAIGPLSIMLQHPLKGENVEQRLQNIDKVLNLELVKKYPDYDEIPSYWKGALREGYQEHLDLFAKEYVRLVADNPGLFLQARMKTFLSANGFDFKKFPASVGMLSTEKFDTEADAAVARRFTDNNLFSTPINTGIKRNVTESLLFFNDSYRFTFWGHVFWNVIPVILLLIIVGLRKLFTRQFFWAFVVVLILARVPLIFITAPANYFMYYLPVYITGYFLLLLTLLLYIDTHKKQLHKLMQRVKFFKNRSS